MATVERRTNIRIRLVAMLFVISAIAFLDRTNMCVTGPWSTIMTDKRLQR